MLPPTWNQLPCRNIDVKIVDQAKLAGMNACVWMNSSSPRGPSDCSNRNASTLTMMIATVTKGVVREGMTSRSGNMREV